MMQVQTKNQPKYSNLKLFFLCNMKTADCTMCAQINAYGQGGPGTADGWMHQYPTKVLQLRNWKMSRRFFSQMWVVHCLRADQSKIGNVHKRLERQTLVPILHSIFDNEITFDPNSESGILTRTLQAPIAGSPEGLRKRCLGKRY